MTGFNSCSVGEGGKRLDETGDDAELYGTDTVSEHNRWGRGTFHNKVYRSPNQRSEKRQKTIFIVFLERTA